MLPVVDLEVVVGLGEQEVQQGEAHEGRGQRGPHAAGQRDAHDGGEHDQHERGQRQLAAQRDQGGDQRRDAERGQREAEAAPPGADDAAAGAGAPGGRDPLVGDEVDVDRPGLGGRGDPDAPGDQLREPAAPGGAEDELGGVGAARELQERLDGRVADDLVEGAAQVFDEEPLAGEVAGVVGAGQAVAGGDVDRLELGAGAGGDAPGAADERVALGAAGQGDDDALLRLPDGGDVLVGAVPLELVLDLVGQPQQRDLAQRGEVADPEVVRQRGVDPLGRVDVAVEHAAAQGLGRDVGELDLVGAADDLVGDGLALRHAGDGGDDVAQRFEVLDVDRGDDVDPGVEELVDVLPALGVAGAGDVGVGELVDERDRGRARQDRVDVELLERGTAVVERAARDDLEPLQERGGGGPAVGLDEADHDVGAAPGAPVRLLERRERLPHARGGPEVDPKLAACHSH